ncbi:pyridoxine kinase [Metarhizium rileyi]|uniref:pyridoxal kinase n=1 Tax=Metarhizium rileyi (strain RCEF 4871) TaxID=1649241 RepID=A0A162KD65_METRR|nr:pyridoxine kinase [Metarhizium rileyi RCEF 4871]
MVYTMKIYVDGGCRGNGQPGAVAAAAAAVKKRNGKYHCWTRSLPLYPTPTNQRAEITAIIMALEVALERYRDLDTNPYMDVTIYSDSRYAIGCMTKWIYKWSRNGWTNAAGFEVANRDLIEEASDLDDRLKEEGDVEYVGNKIAVFTLQSLGYDVAALNTVQFSNHTGYRQWTGTKVTAQEITDLYHGLRQSYLDDFDMMLSGYIPGAEAVVAVGNIARELKERNKAAPGKFFWVLDPVMGDNGKLYVAEDVVPAYKGLIGHADLILPNQFEAELLSAVKIVDLVSLSAAIQALHDKYRIPHVIITSVSFSPEQPPSHLSVIGSSMTSTGKARLFKISFPSIDCYFCGTGDMFGALLTARMREAVQSVPGLASCASWLSDDTVSAVELPLARAAEQVLASMHEVLTKTRDAMPSVIERTRARLKEDDRVSGKGEQQIKSKASELQLVQNLECLRSPGVQFKAQQL